MHVASIQIGKVVTEGDPNSNDVTDRLWSSAFDKRPIDGAANLDSLGVQGDEVANTKNHGGIDKAVLCYALSHYRYWAQLHPELEIGPGGMGENLTIDGHEETSVCIGDRYQVGACQIEVSQPRQPCWKIARRWGVKSIPKAVGQTGYTGWYVRVITPGKVAVGDKVALIKRPHPDWPVSRANDVLMGREVDRMAVIELMSLPELADAWKDAIA